MNHHRAIASLAAVGLLLLAQGVSLRPAQAQRHVVLSLDRTVQLATDSSLSAHKYQSVYDASRHRHLAWQASRKPQFMVEATPLSYERYMTRRYLSVENVDVYRQQRMLFSQAGITATQAMEPWGGQFYGSTELGLLRTFGDEGQTQFMTVPVAVGYRQELLFFNPYKWARQIENIKLSRAEKELAYGIEAVSEQAVAKFFALALAQEQQRMAEEYLASCDTIYAIAERRFKIASISQAELSMLEFEKTNARNTLANARIARLRAVRELAAFLGLEPATEIELAIPPAAPLRVDAAEAMALARENNPKYLESRQATAEARRDADRARVEKNLDISLDISLGLNQVADRFADAYRHPLSQDMAVVTLSIPLKDWGQRKHAFLAASSAVEAAQTAEQETARDIETEVALSVADFNERRTIAETSRQALAIAEQAYAQTLQAFIKGQSDIYSLSLAQNQWQTARQNQIASLQNYWMAYYHLRHLTLYDHLHRQPVTHRR